VATHAAKRVRLLRHYVSALFIPPYPLNILYIGARPKRIQCVPELHEVGHSLTLLELIPRFAEEYRDTFFDEIIVGDVRDLQRIMTTRYDVTFWWHGPEHLEWNESTEVIESIERLTNYLVVLASPYGKTKFQLYNHPGQSHVSAWYPRDYTRMGYAVQVIGRKDAGLRHIYSHVMGWKWLKSLPLPERIID